MLEVPNAAIRPAVLVAGVTGLRRWEIRGLKWHDIDLDEHWLTPTRGSVRKHVTNLKTRASGEASPSPRRCQRLSANGGSGRLTAPMPTGYSHPQLPRAAPRTGSILRSIVSFDLRRCVQRSQSKSGGIP